GRGSAARAGEVIHCPGPAVAPNDPPEERVVARWVEAGEPSVMPYGRQRRCPHLVARWEHRRGRDHFVCPDCGLSYSPEGSGGPVLYTAERICSHLGADLRRRGRGEMYCAACGLVLGAGQQVPSWAAEREAARE